ncbi:MAG: very short patch repair endonuclease [Candidatus Ratteibacteria bacterium]|jgi:DNA mismatch endonuclease (patch repair protein)
MSDRLTKEQRSYCMSRIRSKNTKAEIILQKKLSELNLVYETYSKDLPGTPDVVFRSSKIAIFIDGEFWHGKNFNLRKETYSEYWLKKITRNIQRDNEVNMELEKMGWKVLRIWEKDFMKNPDKYVKKIKKMVVL